MGKNKENCIKFLEASKNIYQCKRCKTNIACFQKPILCYCGHTRFIKIDRKSIDDDITLVIEVYRGCVTGVKNLPKGWKYIIKDLEQG